MKECVLKHFEKVDKKLFEAVSPEMKRVTLDNAKKTPNEYFISLCRSIVGQQLSRKAARTIYLRFKALFPKNTISPKKLLKFTEHDLRGVGMSYGKARALRDLADKILEKKISFACIHEYDNEKIEDMLLQIHGVGPWTVEMFMMFSLGREDIFSTKDLGLQKGVRKIYNLKSKPDEKKMEKISKKWSPYQTYAALILWNSVDNH
ncbi:DNA-3-methyladenine glycosylase 2 family protein [Patescibacteria group bacterium]|nr:DNA-3-methyladenine glycosylase 2 family protein [Patescibacteria group bacterium]